MPADPVLVFYNTSWSSEIPCKSMHLIFSDIVNCTSCYPSAPCKRVINKDSMTAMERVAVLKLWRNIQYSRPTNIYVSAKLLLLLPTTSSALLPTSPQGSLEGPMWFKLHAIGYDYHYFMSHIGSQKSPQRPRLYPWIQHLKTKWLRRLESVSKKMCCVHNLHRWWNIFFLHWWTNLRLLWLQKMEPTQLTTFFTSPTPILWRYGHLAHLDPAKWRSVSVAPSRLTRRARHGMS